MNFWGGVSNLKGAKIKGVHFLEKYILCSHRDIPCDGSFSHLRIPPGSVEHTKDLGMQGEGSSMTEILNGYHFHMYGRSWSNSSTGNNDRSLEDENIRNMNTLLPLIFDPL